VLGVTQPAATPAPRPWQARLPFYYGWVVVGVSFWMGFVGGGQSWAMGVLSLPMEQEMGWSRSAIFGALTLRTYLGAFVAPFIGPYFDRPNGARIATLVSGTLTTAALVMITQVRTEMEFVLWFGVLGGLATAGQAGSVFSAIIPKWFIQKRGTALGYATMGSGVAALAIPPIVAVLIDVLGWRGTWTAIAVLTFLTSAVPAIFIRRQPEDVGLLPDGRREPLPAAAGQPAPHPFAEQRSYTLGQVLHSKLFWVLLFGVSIGTFNNGGVPASLVPMYTSLGLTREMGVLGFSIYGVFSILGRFGWGWLLNRMHIRWVLVAMAVMGFTTSPLILVLHGPASLLFSVFTGFSVGGYVAFNQVIWAAYYGRGHLGAITGFAWPARALVNGAGPFLMALSFDHFGGYGPAMGLVVVCWVLCAATLLVCKPPALETAPPAPART